ncbi:hypothetical protein QOT17_018905 [Balamuthia mandrillaris]
MKRCALLLLCLLLASHEATSARAKRAAGEEKKEGRFDAFLSPSHPDAKCVHKSEVNFGDTGCEHFLTYDMIYTVPGVELPNQTEEGIELWREVLRSSTLTAIANQACRIRSARYMCPTYFRECREVVSPYADPTHYSMDQVAVVGNYACRYLCREVEEPCQSSVPDHFKDVFFNCDVPNPHYFGETIYNIFPEAPGMTVQLTAPNNDTWAYEFQCYDASRDISYVTPFNCPQGMHRNEDDSCSFDCPEPLLSNNEFDTITTMMSVVAWISLVLMAFLIATYLSDPTKRKFPTHLPMFFFVAVMCFSFAFCLPSTLPDGTEEILCESSNKPNYFGDGACTVQGILIVYFFIAAVLWWFVICFNIFLMMIIAAKGIDIQKGNQELFLQLGYHCFAWILPLLPVIIGLAAQQLGANGSDLWCTIHSTDADNELKFVIGEGDGIEAEGETANVWNFVLFWMPIVLCIVTGVSLITVVIIFQLRQEAGVKGCWTYVKGQWRIFAFLALYVWVCVFLFTFQLDFMGKRHDQYDEYEEHIQCLFQKTASEYYFKEIEQVPVPEDKVYICEVDAKINYPLWVLAAFNFAGQGIFVFLIFGASRRIYVVWLRFFTCRVRPFTATAQDSVTKIQTLATHSTSVLTTKFSESQSVE